MRFLRSRLVFFAAAGLVLLTGLPAAHAEGDYTTPILHSFTRSSPGIVGPGDTVSINYDAADDMGPVSYVEFEFVGPVGQLLVKTSLGAGDHGTATAPIPSTGATGAYRLDRVFVADGRGNYAIYFSYGYIDKGPDGAVGPTSHTIDFGPASFTVANLGADVIAPTLVSFQRTSPANAAPGDDVVLDFKVADVGSGVSYGLFRWESPVGGPENTYAAAFNSLASLSDPIEWHVYAFSPGGDYRLADIYIADKAGNTSWYFRDGRVGVSPAGAIKPSPVHLFDFSAADVTVDNPNGDIDAPILHSVTRTSPENVGPGETVVVDFDATDPTTNVSWLSMGWEGPFGHVLWSGGGSAPQADVRVTVPASAPSGLYRLRQVDLRDGAGYRSIYYGAASYYAGQVEKIPAGIVGATTHTVDLAAGDFIVDNGPVPTTTTTTVTSTPSTTSTTSTTVANQAPMPRFGKFAQTNPHWVFVNGIPSVDSDGSIAKYEWRWGDGSKPNTFRFGWHQYRQAGWYLIRLTVTDNRGAATTRGIWFRAD